MASLEKVLEKLDEHHKSNAQEHKELFQFLASITNRTTALEVKARYFTWFMFAAVGGLISIVVGILS